MSRRRSLLAGALAVALAAGLSMVGTVGAASADDRDGDDLAGQRYVALGDSYTSSPLTGPPAGLPLGCLRSQNNYPHLVAGSTEAQLDDVSCSGATTEDFASPQAVRGGSNPPQYDALAPDTELVTVGIGGNDIGFGGIVTGCVSPTPFGTPCRDENEGTLEPRIDALEATLVDVLSEVRSRSPKARVLIVGYPQILPTTGPGCYPVVPYTAGDVEYLRGILERLNGVVRSAADSGGAEYVDTAAATVGHDVCTPPGEKWIEGLIPTEPAAPVHPNAKGAAALSRAVLATLGSAA